MEKFYMQKSDNDLSVALALVDDVVAEINKIREAPDSSFKDVYDEACQKATNFNFDIKKPRTTSKQTLRSNVPADSVEQYFMRAIFIPFIDQMLSQLHERFTRHRNILKDFLTLLPNGKEAPTANATKDFCRLCEFYERDLQSTNPAILNAEFNLWYKKFETITPCKNVIDAISLCDKEIYPNIYNLLKIFATLPVTTCVSERSFSSLRLLKTYLRSTMTQTRLNGLALLYIHRDINVSMTEVIQELCKKKRKLDFIL
jgi:hAT family C-terminal dimerisation region